MAIRGMKGQLNMFDFFHSLDNGGHGEVEMVSLVPEFDDEAEEKVESEPEAEAEEEVESEPEAEAEEEVESESEAEVEEEVESETEVKVEEEKKSELEVEAEEKEESEPEVEAEEKEESESEVEIEQEKTARKEMEKIAMSRQYEIAGEKIEIAYINYNKVRIIQGNQIPVIKEFPSSKEAVDFYVEKMKEYENEKE